MINTAVPPKAPINRLTKITIVCPRPSFLNIKLKMYVKDTIEGPYNKYNTYI